MYITGEYYYYRLEWVDWLLICK